MKISTLIGSDKGGVGKSLLSQLIVAAHDNGKVPLKVAEIDHQRKLVSIFGDRIDLSISPHASGSLGNAVGLRARGGYRFDEVYEICASGDTLIDFGANITNPFFEWIERAEIVDFASRNGIGFGFVALAVPDDQALRSAAENLLTARRVLGRQAPLFLVLNDTGTVAGFEPYRTTKAWTDLQTALASTGATTLQMQPCISGVMEWGKAHGYSLLDLLAPGSNALGEIRRRASYNEIEMQEHLREFKVWVRSIQTALEPLFEAMHDNGHASDGRVVPLRQSA